MIQWVIWRYPDRKTSTETEKPPDFAEVTGLLQRILADAKLELKEAETAERTAEAEYQGFLKDLGGGRDPLGPGKIIPNASKKIEIDGCN